MKTPDVVVPYPDEFKIGREELRKYIVAVKRFDWPVEYDKALSIARRLYEAGTHEMCQGRDGPMIIQYLIPRNVPVRLREFPMAHTADR